LSPHVGRRREPLPARRNPVSRDRIRAARLFPDQAAEDAGRLALPDAGGIALPIAGSSAAKPESPPETTGPKDPRGDSDVPILLGALSRASRPSARRFLLPVRSRRRLVCLVKDLRGSFCVSPSSGFARGFLPVCLALARAASHYRATGVEQSRTRFSDFPAETR